MGDARDFDTVARILQGKSRDEITAYDKAYLERTGGKQTLYARLKEIVPDAKRVEVLRPFRRNTTSARARRPSTGRSSTRRTTPASTLASPA